MTARDDVTSQPPPPCPPCSVTSAETSHHFSPIGFSTPKACVVQPFRGLPVLLRVSLSEKKEISCSLVACSAVVGQSLDASGAPLLGLQPAPDAAIRDGKHRSPEGRVCERVGTMGGLGIGEYMILLYTSRTGNEPCDIKY